ncbi:MAG: hypothetical protein ACT4P6_07910 [Gemmatimonadaceae bacterium]
MSDRLKTVTHRGCSILISDYSHLTGRKEWEALLDAEHKMMAAQPVGSVRSLSILTGARISPEVLDAMKTVTAKNKPHIKASAIVGMSAVQRQVLIKAVERDADRTWHAFDTVDEALDWLARPESGGAA